MGVRGKVWRVARSAVFLEGEKSDTFSLEQGVAQGCSLSPILSSVSILLEVEKAGLGVQHNNGKSIGGLLFAADFCGYERFKGEFTEAY